MKHMKDHMDTGGKRPGHAMYKNEVEEPHIPMHGHQDKEMGCHDMKGEAQEIAYGQAGEKGCKSDSKKMASQFKNYHWDSDTGGASGY